MFPTFANSARRMTVSGLSNGVTTNSAVATVVKREMATLKDLKLRINATTNISKITKSMQMIASTKLSRAQREMVTARKHGASLLSFYKNAETQTAQGGEGKTLYIAVSSDKGLCGGCHSYVSRFVRDQLKAEENPANADVVVLGDKARAQLTRFAPSNMTLSFNHLGSKPPTFYEASLIASEILKLPNEYKSIKLVYNRFQSAIAYETGFFPIHTPQELAQSAKINAYEVEDDAMQSLYEFNLTNAIFCAMIDGYASETSAKMSAMDNATKNAGELIGKLTIVYNRSRQAAITTELVDIITGASAL
ncbi:hypothetical protein H696_02861 [Fonticula alba]|uniref:ATP synthase subunit gamma n=1 Tax=Fonticula alba TaxID=691883 RepID=A0A058ZAQ7_FONAL|nr:hypothetical protein H696_02861 [Fonticula alba]KCV70512.1 hypothetical protein H696_02861 [Fonticula alba]|eukprot:XP_009495028.1 hypothetical protein H696_02861 [Fonticula alba]